jgi:glucose/arabinose dehydrogenase
MPRRPRLALVVSLLVPLSLIQVGATCGLLVDATPVVAGLTSPIYVTAPVGDPRLFIVQRGGLVRIANPDTGVIQASPFLDIRSRISTAGEGGLLSIAFPPDFASTGRFYAYFIEAGTLDSVLARFTLTNPAGSVASPGTEQVILRVDQPAATNHKGGTIAFSPIDRYLYLALGDGGSSRSTAQDGSSLLGKMLRLNVSGAGAGYTIPATNPFVRNAAIRDEIWALGFRNPFRFGFDRETGMLWIADVGEDAWEEVNVELPGMGGRNYGWPVHEGRACLDNAHPAGPCENPNTPVRFAFPVDQYGHDAGCSITGGRPYRGAGRTWQGVYFFADFCSERFYGRLTNGMRVELTQNFLANGVTFNGISAIAEDGFGELYVANLNSGLIHRLELGGNGTAAAEE